jgi:hypothetical protein
MGDPGSIFRVPLGPSFDGNHAMDHGHVMILVQIDGQSVCQLVTLHLKRIVLARQQAAGGGQYKQEKQFFHDSTGLSLAMKILNIL